MRHLTPRPDFGTVVRNLATGDKVFFHLGDNLFGTVVVLKTTKGRARIAFQFHKTVGINQSEEPCKRASSTGATNGSSRSSSASSASCAEQP